MRIRIAYAWISLTFTCPNRPDTILAIADGDGDGDGNGAKRQRQQEPEQEQEQAQGQAQEQRQLEDLPDLARHLVCAAMEASTARAWMATDRKARGEVREYVKSVRWRRGAPPLSHRSHASFTAFVARSHGLVKLTSHHTALPPVEALPRTLAVLNLEGHDDGASGSGGLGGLGGLGEGERPESERTESREHRATDAMLTDLLRGAMQQSLKLVGLSLVRELMRLRVDWTTLTTLLKHMPSLRALSLARHALDGLGTEGLTKLLTGGHLRRLTALNLAHCTFDPDRAANMLWSVSGGALPQLRVLVLAGGALDPVALDALALGLRTVRTLRELDLSHARISPPATASPLRQERCLTAFARLLRATSGLHTLDLSHSQLCPTLSLAADRWSMGIRWSDLAHGRVPSDAAMGALVQQVLTVTQEAGGKGAWPLHDMVDIAKQVYSQMQAHVQAQMQAHAHAQAQSGVVVGQLRKLVLSHVGLGADAGATLDGLVALLRMYPALTELDLEGNPLGVDEATHLGAQLAIVTPHLRSLRWEGKDPTRALPTPAFMRAGPVVDCALDDRTSRRRTIASDGSDDPDADIAFRLHL
jgi:hypothetical protein